MKSIILTWKFGKLADCFITIQSEKLFIWLIAETIGWIKAFLLDFCLEIHNAIIGTLTQGFIAVFDLISLVYMIL